MNNQSIGEWIGAILIGVIIGSSFTISCAEAWRRDPNDAVTLHRDIANEHRAALGQASLEETECPFCAAWSADAEARPCYLSMEPQK